MLLRSISSHVRSQNWLAVALDFVIVVVGIFVGLQADAWNSERKDRARERAAIEQLLTDFTINGEVATRMADYHAEKADELMFAINALTKGELATDEAVRFRNAFVSMVQLPPLGATMGGFNAMLASGDFALIQDQGLRSMLIQLSADLEAERSLLSYFRDMNNTQAIGPAQDLILVVPTDDRTGTRLLVDFAAAKDDYRVLTIVSGQRRNHQVFEGFRRSIAKGFEDASNRIRQVLDEQ